MTLAEARALFFERSSLGPDGGYFDRWVRVEARPFSFYFPNTRARVEAAKLHDLHHLATGYATDWPGEAEIAAWELAGGCARHAWAWVLDLGAFGVGMVMIPKRLFRAFVRGRRARNLYRGGFPEERLGEVTVGALRERMRVHGDRVSGRWGDTVAFMAWCVAAVAWYGLFAAAWMVPLWWVVRSW